MFDLIAAVEEVFGENIEGQNAAPSVKVAQVFKGEESTTYRATGSKEAVLLWTHASFRAKYPAGYSTFVGSLHANPDGTWSVVLYLRHQF